MINRIYNASAVKSRRRLLRESQTDAERKIWGILRNKQMSGLKFYRQYSVGHYILDFFCPIKQLAIELDGGHHAEGVHAQHDEVRTKYLVQHKIQVLRFWNNEVVNNMEGVWEKIKTTVDRP